MSQRRPEEEPARLSSSLALPCFHLLHPVVRFFSSIGLQGYAYRAVEELHLSSVEEVCHFIHPRGGTDAMESGGRLKGVGAEMRGAIALIGEGAPRQHYVDIVKGIERWEKNRKRDAEIQRKNDAAAVALEVKKRKLEGRSAATTHKRKRSAPKAKSGADIVVDHALLDKIWRAAQPLPHAADPVAKENEMSSSTPTAVEDQTDGRDSQAMRLASEVFPKEQHALERRVGVAPPSVASLPHDASPHNLSSPPLLPFTAHAEGPTWHASPMEDTSTTTSSTPCPGVSAATWMRRYMRKRTPKNVSMGAVGAVDIHECDDSSRCHAAPSPMEVVDVDAWLNEEQEAEEEEEEGVPPPSRTALPSPSSTTSLCLPSSCTVAQRRSIPAVVDEKRGRGGDPPSPPPPWPVGLPIDARERIRESRKEEDRIEIQTVNAEDSPQEKKKNGVVDEVDRIPIGPISTAAVKAWQTERDAERRPASGTDDPPTTVLCHPPSLPPTSALSPPSWRGTTEKHLSLSCPLPTFSPSSFSWSSTVERRPDEVLPGVQKKSTSPEAPMTSSLPSQEERERRSRYSSEYSGTSRTDSGSTTMEAWMQDFPCVTNWCGTSSTALPERVAIPDGLSCDRPPMEEQRDGSGGEGTGFSCRPVGKTEAMEPLWWREKEWTTARRTSGEMETGGRVADVGGNTPVVLSHTVDLLSHWTVASVEIDDTASVRRKIEGENGWSSLRTPTTITSRAPFQEDHHRCAPWREEGDDARRPKERIIEEEEEGREGGGSGRTEAHTQRRTTLEMVSKTHNAFSFSPPTATPAVAKEGIHKALEEKADGDDNGERGDAAPRPAHEPNEKEKNEDDWWKDVGWDSLSPPTQLTLSPSVDKTQEASSAPMETVLTMAMPKSHHIDRLPHTWASPIGTGTKTMGAEKKNEKNAGGSGGMDDRDNPAVQQWGTAGRIPYPQEAAIATAAHESAYKHTLYHAEEREKRVTDEEEEEERNGGRTTPRSGPFFSFIPDPPPRSPLPSPILAAPPPFFLSASSPSLGRPLSPLLSAEAHSSQGWEDHTTRKKRGPPRGGRSRTEMTPSDAKREEEKDRKEIFTWTHTSPSRTPLEGRDKNSISLCSSTSVPTPKRKQEEGKHLSSNTTEEDEGEKPSLRTSLSPLHASLRLPSDASIFLASFLDEEEDACDAIPLASIQNTFREEVLPFYLHRLSRYSGLPPYCRVTAKDLLEMEKRCHRPPHDGRTNFSSPKKMTHANTMERKRLGKETETATGLTTSGAQEHDAFSSSFFSPSSSASCILPPGAPLELPLTEEEAKREEMNEYTRCILTALCADTMESKGLLHCGFSSSSCEMEEEVSMKDRMEKESKGPYTSSSHASNVPPVSSTSSWTPLEELLLMAPIDFHAAVETVRKEFPFISASRVQRLLQANGVVTDLCRSSPLTAFLSMHGSPSPPSFYRSGHGA